MGEKPYYPLHIFIVGINLNEIKCGKASDGARAMKLVLNKCSLNKCSSVEFK